MSFFIESQPSDTTTIVLFSTHTDNDPYKRNLSNLGGTFCRELETQQGNKHPAWIFDVSKKDEVEAFVAETDDRESVTSQPDVELYFDEIFRRLESLEKAMDNIYETVEELKSAHSNKRRHK